MLIVGGVPNNHNDKVEEHNDEALQVVARLEGEGGALATRAGGGPGTSGVRLVLDEDERKNDVEEDSVGDIDDDEGLGRGDRPSHIVNCVCFLSVKASPEAKTPISQI